MVRKLDGINDRSPDDLVADSPEQVEHLSEDEYVGFQRQLFWPLVGETSIEPAKREFVAWMDLVDEDSNIPKPTNDWDQVLIGRMVDHRKPTPIMVKGPDKGYDPHDITARPESRTQAKASTEYGSCLRATI